MAKTRATVDRYVNRAYIDCTMSAADTITFQQVRWAVGLFQGIAIKLVRVDWYPLAATLRELAANTDLFKVALTSRDDLSSLDPTNQAVYITESLIGMGAGVEPIHTPLTTDLSKLPEGGLLVPANPMFVGMISAGFAAAGRVRCIIYYNFVHLSDKESIEVLQTVIPGNV